MNKKVKWCGILFFIVIIGMIAFWYLRLVNAQVYKEQIIEGNTENIDGRDFILKTGTITKLSFCNDNADKATDDPVKLKVDITDSKGKKLWEQTFEQIILPMNSFGDELTANHVPELKGQEHYQISVAVNGEVQNDISVAVYGEKSTVLPLYLVCCALIIAIIACSVICFSGIAQIHFKAGFAISMLLLGILSSIVLIPLCVPDEESHFMKAYHISNEMMGISEQGYTLVVTESGITRMPDFDNIQNVYFYWTDWTYGNEHINGRSGRYVEYALNFSAADVAYIPSAIILTVFRSIHAPYQLILLAARMINLVLLLTVALIGMRICPKWEKAIAAICLLPSTIWLGASFSYDTWNLAFSLLFVLYCYYCADRIKEMHLSNLIILFSVLILVAPVKAVYIVMALSILFISFQKWKDKKLIYGCGISVFIAFAVMMVIRGHEIIAALTSNAMDLRAMGDGTSSYTVQWIVRHPLNTFLVFIHTGILNTDEYLTKEIAGEFLIDYVPSFLIAGIGLAFVIILMTCLENSMVGKRERTIAGVLFVTGCLTILTAFLFVYTNVSKDGIGYIGGVQGRYFIPFLIFLPYLLHNEKVSQYVKIRWKGNGQIYLLMFIVVLGAYTFLCKFSGMALHL